MIVTDRAIDMHSTHSIPIHDNEVVILPLGCNKTFKFSDVSTHGHGYKL